jgi:hypothetical protein
MKQDPIIMNEFSIFKVLIPEGAMARARTFYNNGSWGKLYFPSWGSSISNTF